MTLFEVEQWILAAGILLASQTQAVGGAVGKSPNSRPTVEG
jgi:hypothetical protein